MGDGGEAVTANGLEILMDHDITRPPAIVALTIIALILITIMAIIMATTTTLTLLLEVHTIMIQVYLGQVLILI